MFGWKRALSLLLALCLMSSWALAEGTEDNDLDGLIVEEVMLDDGDQSEPEDGVLVISDEIYAELSELDMEVDDTIDRGVLELNKNLPENIVNILLVGIDTRSTDLDKGEQHGDVQIILSINKDTGSVKLTSIMRDLYVTIPGYKSKNRINVAYHFGQSNSKLNGSGGQLAMRTINRNFQMNIEYFATINFYGLASIIDSIGGVDLELSAEEAAAINSYLRQHPPAYDNQGKDYQRQELEKVSGVQHLDGVQAVMYARTRHMSGGSNDFERTERQRKLLEVLLQQVMRDGMDGERLMDLMDTASDYVTTNMNWSDMFELAVGLLQSGIIEKAKNGETLMEQFRIPMDGTSKYSTVSGSGGSKMSVVEFTSGGLQKNVVALHEFIFGEYIPAK
ncbi:MAG: LCP family protein [Christensenellaceae bacterium]|nr:LCP family protein [Christensenellaceae bacterium]